MVGTLQDLMRIRQEWQTRICIEEHGHQTLTTPFQDNGGGNPQISGSMVMMKTCFMILTATTVTILCLDRINLTDRVQK